MRSEWTAEHIPGTVIKTAVPGSDNGGTNEENRRNQIELASENRASE